MRILRWLRSQGNYYQGNYSHLQRVACSSILVTMASTSGCSAGRQQLSCRSHIAQRACLHRRQARVCARSNRLNVQAVRHPAALDAHSHAAASTCRWKRLAGTRGMTCRLGWPRRHRVHQLASTTSPRDNFL